MGVDGLVEACEHLAVAIRAEPDARTRMRLCRQSLGLGREAVARAGDLAHADIRALHSVLNLAQRASYGFCRTSPLVTRLAAQRMKNLGMARFPLIRETRPRLVPTDAASLAVGDESLPEGWCDSREQIEAANEGRYLVFGAGADGSWSVTLRYLEGADLFLEPKEYWKFVDALPPVRLRVTTGRMLFGAAERLEQGVVLPMENGSYICQVVTLRAGPTRRFLATLVSSVAAVEPFFQAPDFWENW